MEKKKKKEAYFKLSLSELFQLPAFTPPPPLALLMFFFFFFVSVGNQWAIRGRRSFISCLVSAERAHHRCHHRYYEQQWCSMRLLGFNWLLRYTRLASFAGLVIWLSLCENVCMCVCVLCHRGEAVTRFAVKDGTNFSHLAALASWWITS